MPLLRNLVFSATVSVDHAGEVCTPTSLVPDTRQVIVENVKLNLNFTYHPFAPIRGDLNSDSSHHLVLIVLWYAFWVVVTFFLHIFVGCYLSQPQNGNESRPQICLYRSLIGRSHAGLGGPSILEEGSSSLSSANASDDDPAHVLNSSNGRGRQPAAIGNNDILPCSNPLAGQGGTQNCLSINENDAPTANSHGALTSQPLPNLAPSTALLPWDPVSTPHSGAQCPIIQETRAHPSRPVSSQSNQQPHQDAILDPFRSFPTETTPLLTAHLPQSGPPPPSITNPNAVEPESTDSEETGPLFATLFPIGDLVVDLPTRWFILVVAVTCKEYKVMDPKFDLDFLQKVFGQSKSKRVRLEWLAEGDATLEKIQAKVVSLHREAQETREPYRVRIVNLFD